MICRFCGRTLVNIQETAPPPHDRRRLAKDLEERGKYGSQLSRATTVCRKGSLEQRRQWADRIPFA